MKSVYFIRTRDNRPYILVTVSAGSTDFQPLSEDADEVAQALDTAYQKRAIKESELEGALDDDLMIEGPVTINRASREKIADFLEEAHVPRYERGTKPPALISAKSIYSSDISDIVLDEFPVELRPNIIEYKAMAFLADQTKTTFNYEVKRVRAMWDPTLSIPGTNRRGGWRCPVGTRYGGQITDRFGRNCGWGVARRIANAITNIGERMENVDDRRRGRRVARRNERMIGRLQRDAGEGGRLERGLRGVAERLDGGEAPESAPRNPRERGRGGLFGDDGPLRIGPARMPRQPQQEQRQPQPQRRRTNLRDSEARRMEREVAEPGAPRTEEAPRPPRQPRAPRRRGEAAEPDATTRELGDAPRQGESYDDYVNRKYAEYQRRVEGIQQRGGQAGLLTRDEWYKFNRNNLREAWGRANGGEIPNEDNIVPRPAREPRPRAPRRRRVNASNAQAADTANRRPRPEDQPIPQQRPTARPNRVSPANREEELKRQKRDAIRNISADATAAERREYRDYVNQFDPRAAGMGVPILMQFREWREFNNQVRRANGQRPLGPRAPQAPAAPEADLGGSLPDARSERNVYNRFRQNGLPDTAYWREPDFPEGEEKAELERRFGRYYDNNNKRNARGDYVNDMIRRRGQQGAPQGGRVAPPEPPARPQTPPAPPAPEAPPAPRPQGRVRRARRRNQQPSNDANLAGSASRAANPYPKQENKVGTLGINRENGLMGEYVPNPNPNITTAGQAVVFVRDGGDLSQVPHQFWAQAVKENSSRDATDMTKRFRTIPKNGGIIGETLLYVQRDENGKGTKQGWVFKASSDKDNIGELVGWNYQAALGIQTGGAVIDGKSAQGADYVIIPFATSDVPNNAVELTDAADAGRNYHRAYLDRVPESLPGRVAQFAMNFMLGVSDRHGQNGFGKVFQVPGEDPKAVNVAWDLGWMLERPSANLTQYASSYRMDSKLLLKVKATISGAEVDGVQPLTRAVEKRREIQRETVATLRDMANKTRDMLSVGRDTFINQSVKNMRNGGSQRVRERAGAAYDRMLTHIDTLNRYADQLEAIEVR